MKEGGYKEYEQGKSKEDSYENLKVQQEIKRKQLTIKVKNVYKAWRMK